MYVCICNAVTVQEVERTIQAGASSREEVTVGCRAGGDCGSCHGMIETMLEEHGEAREEPCLVKASALTRGRERAA